MAYALELGPKVREVICECCGHVKNRVWGFVSREGKPHAVYFALLNIDEPEPRVGLTLSAGNWQNQNDAAGRSWIEIELQRVVGEVKMKLIEPTASSLYPWELGGQPLGREQAILNNMIDEFWAVADFIVAEDPALVSYLISEPVSNKGREYSALG